MNKEVPHFIGARTFIVIHANAIHTMMNVEPLQIHVADPSVITLKVNKRFGATSGTIILASDNMQIADATEEVQACVVVKVEDGDVIAGAFNSGAQCPCACQARFCHARDALPLNPDARLHLDLRVQRVAGTRQPNQPAWSILAVEHGGNHIVIQ